MNLSECNRKLIEDLHGALICSQCPFCSQCSLLFAVLNSENSVLFWSMCSPLLPCALLCYLRCFVLTLFSYALCAHCPILCSLCFRLPYCAHCLNFFSLYPTALCSLLLTVIGPALSAIFCIEWSLCFTYWTEGLKPPLAVYGVRSLHGTKTSYGVVCMVTKLWRCITHTHTRTNTHTYTHTHTSTQTHTRTHTHTRTFLFLYWLPLFCVLNLIIVIRQSSLTYSKV